MPNAHVKVKIAAQPVAPQPEAARPLPLGSISQATVVAVRPDGLIDVHGAGGSALTCAWLESSTNVGVVLASGDAVLLTQYSAEAPPVVLGRIGRVGQPSASVELLAGQALSLKCGQSSIDLRADGKVMIRGDDVLVRAKKTKRIRAGTVSIN